ncbi:MAG TPA: hypothetical protein VEL07_15765 [Planctomycetota bacterium]|nr:hypothetical protein [Planctomycetota bacterium]
MSTPLLPLIAMLAATAVASAADRSTPDATLGTTTRVVVHEHGTDVEHDRLHRELDAARDEIAALRSDVAAERRAREDGAAMRQRIAELEQEIASRLVADRTADRMVADIIRASAALAEAAQTTAERLRTVEQAAAAGWCEQIERAAFALRDAAQSIHTDTVADATK